MTIHLSYSVNFRWIKADGLEFKMVTEEIKMTIMGRQIFATNTNQYMPKLFKLPYLQVIE